ncbi:MAG TPA: hypothetical protein VFO76_09585 [Candidatus Kapabacteria bacterium]|nr:hypothetical protein [Candidatus Kapabacteria bacterium]
MDIALSIVALIALVVLIWFLITAAKALQAVTASIGRAESDIKAVKADFDQISNDVTTLKTHLIPAIDNITEITETISGVTDGLKPRVDAIYNTVDDALDIAHGLLEDVERIKSEVVETIEKPIVAFKTTSDGVLSTVIKGVNVVRDLVHQFKRR